MFEDNKYTGKDLKSIREEIIEFIKLGNENWTDFNWSSIQLQYTELLAGVADMLCYYLDNQALETFLMSARQAKNIKGIMSTMNYKIEPMGTAKGEIVVSRKLHEAGMRGSDGNYEEGRYLIPRFSVVSSNLSEIPKYLTIEEKMMDRETLSVNIPIVQGKLVEINVPVSAIRESFKVYLTERAVPLEYVEIVDEGWEKVEDAFVEIQGGKKYSIHIDSKDMVYVLFTYDWTKYLSTEENATMRFRYIVSDGSKGVVDCFQLNKITGNIIDLDTGEDASSVLQVSNPNKTYGAFDKVNLNKQKANARNYIKTYDRIILLEDLETMVRKETWVKDTVCYDWRKNDNVVPYPHQMKAWVITVDGVDVTGNQLTELTNKLQKITVPMTQIEVLSANFVDLNIRIGISLNGNSDTVKENIRSKVEAKINERYSMEEYLKDDENSKLEFGMELSYSKFEYEIGQLNQAINDVMIEGFDGDIQLTETQFFNIPHIEVYLF